MVGWTSAMGAEHNGDTRMDILYGGRPVRPYWDGPPLWGKTIMVIPGWTSTMGADHHSHARMDLRYGGRP